MAHSEQDVRFMRLAMTEALRGLGRTSPNPIVGAVLVRGDHVLATGFHARAGGPHAEVVALRPVRGANLRDCTLFVTLEPCSTVGRTPACTDQIIADGVGRVVFGSLDPNPRHAGRATEILEKAGIEVRSGVLEEECRNLNRPFNKWVATGLPWVIAKAALTLDGRLVLPSRRWLSGWISRREVQRYRSEVDAILVGARTVRVDNPRLTVHRRASGQPWRIVWGRDVPKTAHVLSDAFRDRTIVMGEQDVSALLRELGRREILSLMVEGGGETLGNFNDADAIDEIRFFLTPWISGGSTVIGGQGVTMSNGRRFVPIRYSQLGRDVLVHAIRARAVTS